MNSGGARRPAEPLFLVVFLALLLVFPARTAFPADGATGEARAAGAPTNRIYTTSATGRFVASGPDAFFTMTQTRRAEETAAQLERFLGVKFPLRRPEVIEIRLVSGREAAASPALASSIDNGLLQRAIIINMAASPDPEVIGELLCRALMTGYIRERRRGGAVGPMPAIPEWLTMGVAQNLDPAVRVRNRNVVMAWRPESAVPRLGDVLRWQTLPEGWPRHRALCGMAVGWLGTFGEAVSPYARIMDRLADTGAVTSEWLADELTGRGSVALMEQAWREWMGRQANLIHSFGEVSSDLIEQVRAELPLAAPSGPDGGAPLWVTPREAIARRAEPGVSFAAMQKAQRLRAMTLGKAVELVSLGETYAQFYERLAAGAWTITLNRTLNRAEASLERLADLTRKREAYLDAVERDVQQGSTVWRETSAAQEPVLEKGRLESYVDRAEQKFRETPGETSRD